MILTDVSDTIHADSLALFALNIEILLADVTKPEKSKILTLTWPVTSSVTSGSNFWPCTGSSRTGLSNGVWNLEIGPVVWEISGGGPLGPPPPPPAGRVTNQTPAGRGLIRTVLFILLNDIVCATKTTNLQTTTYKVLWKKLQDGLNEPHPLQDNTAFGIGDWCADEACAENVSKPQVMRQHRR